MKYFITTTNGGMYTIETELTLQEIANELLSNSVLLLNSTVVDFRKIVSIRKVD